MYGCGSQAKLVPGTLRRSEIAREATDMYHVGVYFTISCISLLINRAAIDTRNGAIVLQFMYKNHSMLIILT